MTGSEGTASYGSTQHLMTAQYYYTATVGFGQSCATHMKLFTCNNGVWKDGIINQHGGQVADHDIIFENLDDQLHHL